MFSALISFLGGSVFRTIWGEIAAWVQAKQEHKFELERLQLQEGLAAAQHIRTQDAIRLQAELGVQTIRVQAEAATGRIETEGWAAAVASSMRPTGVAWVDAWNGSVRPAAASIALILWVGALNSQGWKMSDWDMQLVGVILGFFFASRELTKRGK